MTTILVAEDDPHALLLISHRLKTRYTVLSAKDGREALELLQMNHVDLLITDIQMPGLDGFELVQNIRHQGFSLPVLILTANQSFDAKRTGFSLGTDDYLTKPFNYDELLWRIEALLRRSQIVSTQTITIGDFTLDSTSYVIRRGEDCTELPKKEFELLFKLLSSPGRIFTKNQLMDDIWGHSSESGEETVKTHISRLRTRLKPFSECTIIAVKGIGYKAEIREKQEDAATGEENWKREPGAGENNR